VPVGKIGFIGAGSMGEALVKGILEAEIFSPEEILISDLDETRLQELKEKYKVQVSAGNQTLVTEVDYIVLAVKPSVINKVLAEVGSEISADKKIFSIAAGVTTAQIERHLSSEIPVVRLMPNTPALIGKGAIAYTLGSFAGEEEDELVEKLFTPVGLVVETKEELMDAVTGLSGSGPAYIYLLIEALADAGVFAGLSRETATDLTVQTLLGAAQMVKETDKHPAELKDMVTSPGGTTITGVKELEKEGFRAAIYQAVEAATKKSRQLKGE
jgi:pyrroline-5-carboxylate reductase